MRKLKRVLKDWNLNYVWFYMNHKKLMAETKNEIGKESEVVGLSIEKYNVRKELND
jgi:hypothetical protein